MTVDISLIIQDMKTAVSESIGKDVTTVKGFSDRQLRNIAEQTAKLGKGIAAGEISEATRSFLLSQLVELAQNFARTLTGLLLITIEKVWNSIVQIIHKTIAAITGIAFDKA